MSNKIDINDYTYALARTPSRIIGGTPCPVDQKTGKINPQATSFLREDGKQTTVFHVKPVYYETISGHWRPMSEVCSYYGNHLVVFTFDGIQKVHPRFISWLSKRMELMGGQLRVHNPMTTESIVLSPYLEYLHDLVTIPKFGMTVSTFYPDPSPETTSVDGYLYIQNGTSWNEMHDRASAQGALDSGASGALQNNSSTRIYRAIFLFDTSAIPDTDTIDSAVMSLYGNGTTVDSDSSYVGITVSTPASNTGLVVGDYSQVGATDNPVQQATSILLSAWSNSAYNDFTFNATGEGNISKTGVSKFGARLRNDIIDTAPSGAPEAGFLFAETASTTSDPKLVVTHTGGGGGGNTTNFFQFI